MSLDQGAHQDFLPHRSRSVLRRAQYSSISGDVNMKFTFFEKRCDFPSAYYPKRRSKSP